MQYSSTILIQPQLKVTFKLKDSDKMQEKWQKLKIKTIEINDKCKVFYEILTLRKGCC